jgi:DNA-binding GntR family transcriptional regulator
LNPREGDEMPQHDSAATVGGEAAAIAYGERAGRVHDWILTRILSTELAPGAFIDKAAIAAAIGVSKQPVTVALARLAREGWVEIESRVGSYVARVDPLALREIAYVWFAAETVIAHDAAAQADADIAAALTENGRAGAAALAEARIGDAEAALRAATLTLIERFGNDKAGRYYGLYRAHFGRYLRHVEMSAAARPLAGEARQAVAAAGLGLIEAVARHNLAGVAAAAAAQEALHGQYLDRIAALG